MMTEENDRAAQDRKRIDALHRRAAEANRKLIPETSGAVRMDGPRRQYRAEVHGGMMYWIEE